MLAARTARETTALLASMPATAVTVLVTTIASHVTNQSAS